MYAIVIAIVLGLLGGLIHQLHDSEQKNSAADIGRSAIMGIIAGLLTYFISPSVASTTYGYVALFVAGWFGDSLILNIVRRYKP